MKKTLTWLYPSTGKLIFPSEELSTIELPLYGTIPAGYPAEAYNYIEDRIDLNKLIIRNKSGNCCMWVTNPGLLGPGIEYGDLLVFDTALIPKKDSVCLYWIDDEYSIRRINKEEGGITLVAPNPNTPTFFVGDGETVQRIGVLTHRLKKFSNYRQQYGGYPVDATQFIEKGMDYNKYFIGPDQYWESIFYLHVDGESMTGDGILKNDLLIVDRLADHHDDSIFVFLVDTNFTLKRIECRPDHNLLVGSNPKFPPIRVEKDVKLEPWGVLTGTVTNYLKSNYETLYTL